MISSRLNILSIEAWIIMIRENGQSCSSFVSLNEWQLRDLVYESKMHSLCRSGHGGSFLKKRGLFLPVWSNAHVLVDPFCTSNLSFPCLSLYFSALAWNERPKHARWPKSEHLLRQLGRTKWAKHMSHFSLQAAPCIFAYIQKGVTTSDKGHVSENKTQTVPRLSS